MHEADREAVPTAARYQAGVFTRRQARSEGWTDRQIGYRLDRGWWVRVAGQGLARPSSAWSAHQLAFAAQLTSDRVVTSHLTAALLHRFPLPTDGVSHVISSRVHRSGNGIRVHRLTLGSGDVDSDGALVFTTPARTALDCLSSLNVEDGRALSHGCRLVRS